MAHRNANAATFFGAVGIAFSRALGVARSFTDSIADSSALRYAYRCALGSANRGSHIRAFVKTDSRTHFESFSKPVKLAIPSSFAEATPLTELPSLAFSLSRSF